jgi:hypothetical protein
MTDNEAPESRTYGASVGGGNPVDRLVAFLIASEVAQGSHDARKIFGRITTVRAQDYAGLVRQHLNLIVLAQACRDKARAVKEADPVILEDAVEVFEQTFAALVNLRWDRPWEDFRGKLGPKAAARAQWLRSHYPHGLPDARTVEEWQSRLRRALLKAEAELQRVPEWKRDLGWVQMSAAVSRAIEQLNTVQYAGPAAINRAVAEIRPPNVPVSKQASPAWRELLGEAADLSTVMANSAQLLAFADSPVALVAAVSATVVAGAARRFLSKPSRAPKQLPPQAGPGTGNAGDGDS